MTARQSTRLILRQVLTGPAIRCGQFLQRPSMKAQIGTGSCRQSNRGKGPMGVTARVIQGNSLTHEAPVQCKRPMATPIFG